LFLNVLSDSAEHRRRYGTDDFAGVVTTHSGDVAHPLRHRVVVIAENLRK
jgi:hypothetical protein